MKQFNAGDLVKYDGPAGVFLAEVMRPSILPWVYEGEIVKVISHEKKHSAEDLEILKAIGANVNERYRPGQPVTLLSDDPTGASDDGFGVSVLVAPSGQWNGNELPE